ncbi:membrane hypothetical protein [Vibrio chagasii]|nr:membrane hypothetical protein [Vibrio chagasii]CAH7400861.1 membrane hypothetical protein [Vibrio chagasii]CAH7466721.1 membrane hypothetical protein [Vibrio chagasii]
MNSRNAQAIGLIAVGMVISYLLFLLFNNKFALTLVFGFLVGVIFVTFIFFSHKKFTDFTNNNSDTQGSFSTAFESKLFTIFGVEKNEVNSNEVKFYVDKVFSTIRFFFSSMTIFSVFALCLSIALYYSSILQLDKVSEQNKLICSQNVLANASNEVALFSVESQRLDLSLKLLRENSNDFSQTHRVLQACRNHTRSVEGEFLFSTNDFYKCIEENFYQLKEPLLRYQENEPGAYMSSTPPEDEIDSLRRLHNKLIDIRYADNYRTFNELLEPFNDYMVVLEKLISVTNKQVHSLKDKRLQLLNEINVDSSHCEINV